MERIKVFYKGAYDDGDCRIEMIIWLLITDNGKIA